MSFVFYDMAESVLSIQVSKDFVKMEAEGREIKILISGSEWHIKEILNQNDQVRMYGNVYNLK